MRSSFATLLVLGLALPARAEIDTITPDAGYPGESLSVDVVGQNITYTSTCQVDFEPAGLITVWSTYRVNDQFDQRLRASITINEDALPQVLDLLVICPGVTETARRGFEILDGAALVQALPSSLRQGETRTVTLYGTMTHFDDTSRVDVSGSSVHGEVTAVYSLTLMDVQLKVDAAAPAGPRDVTVITGSEQARGEDLIEIVEQPELVRAEPEYLDQGETRNLVIVGSGTAFQDGDLVSIDGAGAAAIDDSRRLSDHRLQVTVEVAERAPTGPRSVSVYTGGEVLDAEALLTVRPHLTLTPDRVTQGQTTGILAEGGDGWFSDGMTADVGERMGLDNLLVVEGYVASFTVTPEANAVVGPRAVALALGGDTVSGMLTVELDPTTTTLDGISPAAADAGVVGLPVTIQGTNTNFESGATRLENDAGTLDGSGFTAASETRASGLLAVADDAAPGACGVRAVTRYEQVTLASGLSVTAPAAITSVQPMQVDAGATATLTVDADDGQFAAGTTQVYLGGEGVTVDAVRVQNADRLEADVRVAADADGAVRSLKAVTGPRAAVGGQLDVFHPALSAGTPALFEGRAQRVELTAMDFDLTADPQLAFEPADIAISGVEASDADHLAFSATVPRGLGVREAVLTVTVGSASLQIDFELRGVAGSGGGDGGCGCAAGAGRAGGGWLLLALWLATRRRRAG